MVVVKDYSKNTLDDSSLQINAGYVKSKTIDEDTYAMGIQADADFTYAALQSQLLAERNKDLMEITKELRKFLNRIGVDSTFVKQIQDVLRMGQDIVNISVDIINNTTEDKTVEEVIKDITGTEGSTDDVIDNEVKKAEDSLIPPLNRETVINTGKAVVEETKEAAKENNTDVKTAATETRSEPVIVTPETVEAAKTNYEDVAKGIEIDTSKINTPIVVEVAVGTVAFPIVGPIVAAANALDSKDINAAAERAIPEAARAYVEVIQNGGSRKEAQEAAAEVIRNTEVRPEVASGDMYTPAVTLEDKDSTGEIVDVIIDAIETEVGHAIERAGGDVTEYFGGCGCDDTCDCADECSSDCSSDCGCDDSGCTGYVSCDEAPCDGCPSHQGCSSDNPDCPSDCPGDCSNDCGSEWGCVTQCSSD